MTSNLIHHERFKLDLPVFSRSSLEGFADLALTRNMGVSQIAEAQGMLVFDQNSLMAGEASLESQET